LIKNYLSESKRRNALVKKLAKKQVTEEEILTVLTVDQKFPLKRAKEVLANMIEQSKEFI